MIFAALHLPSYITIVLFNDYAHTVVVKIVTFSLEGISLNILGINLDQTKFILSSQVIKE